MKSLYYSPDSKLNMKAISNSDELKKAIRLKEIEQSDDGRLLKEQFYLEAETIKSGNILIKSLKKVIEKPNLVYFISSTAIGLATGYLTKKIVITTSATILKKVLGGILILGISALVSKRSGVKGSAGSIIMDILNKKIIPEI